MEREAASPGGLFFVSEGRRSTIRLMLGDCLERMKEIDDGSVDAVIADPPYGTTACKWDSVIPLEPMWEQLKRVIKPNGAIVLFGSQPFTSVLVMSNLKWFKYCWIWDKKRGKGHLVCKYRPMQRTEDIAVFGQGAISYYPIMEKRDKPRFQIEGGRRTEIMGGQPNPDYKGKIVTHRHPTTVIEMSWSPTTSLHPTQKPVELGRYLIKTFTKENDIILDNACGSGSFLISAVLEGRRFIGIEKNQEGYLFKKKKVDYIEVCNQRIKEAQKRFKAENNKLKLLTSVLFFFK